MLTKKFVTPPLLPEAPLPPSDLYPPWDQIYKKRPLLRKQDTERPLTKRYPDVMIFDGRPFFLFMNSVAWALSISYIAKLTVDNGKGLIDILRACSLTMV